MYSNKARWRAKILNLKGESLNRICASSVKLYSFPNLAGSWSGQVYHQSSEWLMLFVGDFRRKFFSRVWWSNSMISKARDSISGSERLLLYVKYRATGNTSLTSIQRPTLYDPIPKTSVPGTNFTVGMNEILVMPCLESLQRQNSGLLGNGKPTHLFKTNPPNRLCPAN